MLAAYFRIFLLIIVVTSLSYSCTFNKEPLHPSTITSPISPILTPTYVTFTYHPKPGFATICGILILMNPALIAPQEDGLYLVPINTESGAALIVPTVDETSYRAIVDEVTGHFCFKDIPQGIYVLLAVTDNGSEISVRNFETGQAVIITVTQENLNKVTDIGATRLP